ncbi:MAG TPA: hypothetical protein DEG17_00705 [Cyanobacteria bacterium UBA11149]|nr:hypothetical protein [Cyanobacteria bacterium UBA11367]HBE58714.1 hypothetical protein [Cyanobacteria bacterium UBA11366]HBK62874.1 hypothetical protein [Cyanobacteria bacterium UBA11166]HBR76748.1 hypothetical protein [Cyanobacteria bacterium UBA11159]HBS68536.1 hypothetical protein [Cyanobacteria bacterium UBA11153]HBW87433.1 hypothetical protein [Cyanobacteria bacterium UBA11149]HCA93511.1 hypothetical protein [Cyanobacteria bacterium UBA9226]
MFTQNYYLILSKTDGRYLAAKPKSGGKEGGAGYLLMFRENFEALSYLNTHASDVANRFAVESVSGSQLKGLLRRWGFLGVGIVQDPLIPQIEFMIHQG